MSKLASLAVVVMGSIAFISIGCGSGSDVFGSSSTSSATGAGGTSSSSGTTGAGGAGGMSSGSSASSSSGKGSSGAGGAGGSGMMIGQPPKVKINHPGDMEMRPANIPIPFVGVANDPEDGALTGASLVWTSSLAGMIGTGEMFNAPLKVGTHVITLTATDSNKNTGVAAITLYIQ